MSESDITAGATTIDTGSEDEKSSQLHRRFEAIWGTAPGIAQLSAVNHTTIGKYFIVTGFVFFVLGGLLSMLIRAQLALPENDVLDEKLYRQFFTMHGTTMMFLFAVPVLEGFAVYLIPKMIGTRDLVFPRLSAFGYWCYLFGGSILIAGLVLGLAPDGGWFMYPPLTTDPALSGIGADIWMLGLSFIEVASIAAAVELIVGIMKCRAPGMRINLMPLFAWYLLIVAGMILFAKASGWPIETYWHADHPVQRQALETISALSDIPVEQIALATDGCGVVTFGMPMRGLAVAFARLADPSAVADPPLRAALIRADVVDRPDYSVVSRALGMPVAHENAAYSSASPSSLPSPLASRLASCATRST